MPSLVLGPLLRHVDETSATVWVGTDRPCEVQVLDCSSPTFTVAGHHYALVVCSGLQPGTTTTYGVRLDGEQVWPPADDPFPPPTVRTRTGDGAEQLRLLFGSCRVTRPHEPPYTRAWGKQAVGVDALHAYALRMLGREEPDWPDALLLVGDQVYADEVSPDTLAHIERTRGTAAPPGKGIADFEEYTLLYREAWSDPVIRWVLSTLPTAMVFDDHDIHDDWNTSAAWRRSMQSTDWWAARIEGGLMSYWLYQHLGNMSPAELTENDLWAQLKQLDDGDEVLRAYARRADAEADGGDGVRWSYLAQAHFPAERGVRSVVHQAVCSPVRNPVNRPIQLGDRFARTAAGRALGRLMMVAAGVPMPSVSWRVDHGPRFDNEIGAMELEGRSAVFRLERAVPGDPQERLETVLEQRLA